MGAGTHVTGGAGVLLTTLFGATMLQDSPTNLDDLNLPVVPVNVDSAILSEWLSESINSYNDDPLEGECNFFNFSKAHSANFCDIFTISRMQSGTVAAATNRALRCAAKTGTECVLSSEVGFAVPAAFWPPGCPRRNEGLDRAAAGAAPARRPASESQARARLGADRHLRLAHGRLQRHAASRVPLDRPACKQRGLHRRRGVLREPAPRRLRGGVLGQAGWTVVVCKIL